MPKKAGTHHVCERPNCTAKFESQGKLSMHLMLFHGEFGACEYCGKRYASESILLKHKRFVHGKS